MKMDVGGFGSNVLTPILKDVPVINRYYLQRVQQKQRKMKKPMVDIIA